MSFFNWFKTKKRLIDEINYLNSKYLEEKERKHLDIKSLSKQQNLRSQLEWFANKMEFELKQNDYKGGWKNDTFKQLFEKLELKYNNLEMSLSTPKMEYVILDCIDLANYAMMIADNAKDELNYATK